MQQTGNNPQPDKQIIYFSPALPESNEIGGEDLRAIWNTLWPAKWFIIGFPLLCTLVSVFLVLYVLPVTYKSNVVLQPTQSNAGGALSKLSGLADSLPIPIDIPGQENKGQQIIDFLNSRTLKKRLIEKYDLLPRLYPEIWNAETHKWMVEDPDEKPTLVKVLQNESLNNIYNLYQDDGTGLITVSWVDEEPEFTAKILDGIVKELRHYLNHEYESDAKRERIFIEKQLEKASGELEYWEKQVPSNDLTLSKIKREEMAAITVYTELRKQLELSKIAEVKDIIRFKVLDEAFVPEIKHEPKGSIICGLTLIAFGFLSILMVYLRKIFISTRSSQNK